MVSLLILLSQGTHFYTCGSLKSFLYYLVAAAAAKSLQSCPTLCDPIDGSPPGSPIPGILQARTLEWVAISFSNAKVKSESEVAQSCPTLSDFMDCRLLRPWDFPGKSTGVGCCYLLCILYIEKLKVST